MEAKENVKKEGFADRVREALAAVRRYDVYAGMDGDSYGQSFATLDYREDKEGSWMRDDSFDPLIELLEESLHVDDQLAEAMEAARVLAKVISRLEESGVSFADAHAALATVQKWEGK